MSSSKGHSCRDSLRMPGQQQHNSLLDQVIIMANRGLVVAAYLKVERVKLSSSKGHSFRDSLRMPATPKMTS